MLDDLLPYHQTNAAPNDRQDTAKFAVAAARFFVVLGPSRPILPVRRHCAVAQSPSSSQCPSNATASRLLHRPPSPRRDPHSRRASLSSLPSADTTSAVTQPLSARLISASASCRYSCALTRGMVRPCSPVFSVLAGGRFCSSACVPTERRKYSPASKHVLEQVYPRLLQLEAHMPFTRGDVYFLVQRAHEGASLSRTPRTALSTL